MKKNIIILGNHSNEKLLFAKNVLSQSSDYNLKKIDGSLYADYKNIYNDSKIDNNKIFTNNNFYHQLNSILANNDIVYFFCDKFDDLDFFVKKIEFNKYINVVISFSSNSMSEKRNILDLIKKLKNKLISEKSCSFHFFEFDKDINNKKIKIHSFVDKKYTLNFYKIKNFSKKTREQKLLIYDYKIDFPYVIDDAPYDPSLFAEMDITPDIVVENNILNFIYLNIVKYTNVNFISVFIFFSKFYLFLKQYPSFRILNQLFYYPKNTYKRNIRMIKRIFDIIMMTILLYFLPQNLHYFSTRKQLLSKKYQRKPLNIPSLVNEKESYGMEYCDEINVIMRGNSLLNSNIKMLNVPTFLLSITNPNQFERIEDKIKLDSKNIFFVYPNLPYIKNLLKHGYKCVYIDSHESFEKDDEKKKLENIEKNFCILNNVKYIRSQKILFKNIPKDTYTPYGSGLNALTALMPFAKKINVYGWDFHIDKLPNKTNYFKFIYHCYSYSCDKRSLNHFEALLINLYFGYTFSKMPKLKIYSNLGKLQKYEKIIKKIERALFQQNT